MAVPRKGCTMKPMPPREFLLLAAILGSLDIPALAAHSRSCVTADQATQMVNKDICVSAHVYDVVELSDGTRYLDVCAPDTSDDHCRFTFLSRREDRDEVGELAKYRDMDVQVRGIVSPMHGRTGMVVSHSRQFSGGPPKFKANPKLVHGFSGEQEHPPLGDPNLRSQGGRRSFMNTRDRETIPSK
jgi:hypothetical protein